MKGHRGGHPEGKASCRCGPGPPLRGKTNGKPSDHPVEEHEGQPEEREKSKTNHAGRQTPRPCATGRPRIGRRGQRRSSGETVERVWKADRRTGGRGQARGSENKGHCRGKRSPNQGKPLRDEREWGGWEGSRRRGHGSPSCDKQCKETEGKQQPRNNQDRHERGDRKATRKVERKRDVRS